MELIRISESKLKIMLTRPDMERYELETDGMDCTDAHTRAAFRHIFDDARDEVGFDTAGSPLFVQLYASPEGGCEIFVTKLEGEETSSSRSLVTEEMTSLPTVPEPGERRLLERVRGQRSTSPSHGMPQDGYLTAAYAFSNLEDLLAVCRRLRGICLCVRSHVYQEETAAGTVWYLLIEDTDIPLPPFLVEYGRELSIKGILDYVTEHGTAVRIADAVALLGRM